MPNMVITSGTEGKWKYQECSVEVANVGYRELNGACQMCGRPMRFAHILVYPKQLGRIPGTYENHIWVGVDCAAILIDGNPDIPRLAENETARKEKWRVHHSTPGKCRTTVEDLEERGKL